MGKFGWSLPPGVSVADIDAQFSVDLPLEVERVLEVMEGLGFDDDLIDRVEVLLLSAEGFTWSSS